jgi:hypothetical protein
MNFLTNFYYIIEQLHVSPVVLINYSNEVHPDYIYFIIYNQFIFDGKDINELIATIVIG